ncbi:beta-ketoacyl-ACP synthase II [Paenibacillus endoradicis]|uniref:beta-ketoacyl-ACP synthase II n=1 Tax=Paenibacillus endoradicis TaxID=2972487 RepID=UPI002159A3AA|nr:beta-ketoacyl-ACP synthase II [Paenibacillus endoradicis]MCR8656539.1 beta-ketoacyl-ACP synthase II [Paenibacillus endoradicis]
MHRVVITGRGIASPLGNEVDEFWSNLKKGVSGITTIDSFDVSQFGTRIAGLVRNFDSEELFGRKEARKMDRFCQFGLYAAKQAVHDAELPLDKIDLERLGVYVGTGIGGIQTLTDNYDAFLKRGPGRVSPSLVPMMISNMAASQISIHFGAKGPTLSPVTACSIGNTAIGEAFRLIRYGEADVIIAGGTEAAIHPISLASFGNATALSKRNDDPKTASRPFDKDRDGFVMAEGAGIVVLESLEHAMKRGAKIYGEVIGYGASSDAYHVVASHPQGDGALLAMKRALQSASIDPLDIDVVSAHATSTEVGDLAETNALKRLLGDQATKVPITANKSMLGHMFGAAGGVEAIALIESLREGIIPPTINLNNADMECDLDYVPNHARSANLNVGLSNSFGFGGHNAAIVLKKFSEA